MNVLMVQIDPLNHNMNNDYLQQQKISFYHLYIQLSQNHYIHHYHKMHKHALVQENLLEIGNLHLSKMKITKIIFKMLHIKTP